MAVHPLMHPLIAHLRAADDELSADVRSDDQKEDRCEGEDVGLAGGEHEADAAAEHDQQRLEGAVDREQARPHAAARTCTHTAA